MTDRVPGRPRRYKITFEDGGAGTVIYGTIEYADEPVTVGTPLNKATLMPDTLAAKICPGVVDPTPADGMDGLWKGAAWTYTTLLQQSAWVADTSKPGYSYSQTVDVISLDGAYVFNASTVTEPPMVLLTGNAAGDEAMLEDLAIVSQGYRESMPGKMKFYVRERPSSVTALQIFMRGRTTDG